MVAKSYISRLSARIDELARRWDQRPAAVYVWRDTSETEDEALARHFAAKPEDRKAKQIVTLSWLEPA